MLSDSEQSQLRSWSSVFKVDCSRVPPHCSGELREGTKLSAALSSVWFLWLPWSHSDPQQEIEKKVHPSLRQQQTDVSIHRRVVFTVAALQHTALLHHGKGGESFLN